MTTDQVPPAPTLTSAPAGASAQPGPTAQPAGQSAVVHRPPGTGPATWAMGSLFEHLVKADQTEGLLAVSTVTQPPGVATPLHRHTHEAEAFYLLDGTMTYRAGDELFELEAGSFIYLPKGLPHAFRITGRTPARILALAVPGRVLDLYDEVGRPAGERRLPGPEDVSMAEELARWNDVGPRYGLQVVGPPIPE